MPSPSVLSALRAGRDVVASGTVAYYRALPDTDGASYEAAERLLSRALYEACGGYQARPIDVPHELRLRAYDLAIEMAGKERP